MTQRIGSNMETITLTDAHAVAYIENEDGSQSIIGLMPLHILKTPLHSMKGRTGADIRWAAYREAKITEDYRYEP